MRKLIISTLFLLLISSTASAAPLLGDTFESGNLDSWTIGGRQLGTANVADVVTTSNGTLGGHLYHAGATEINLSKDFFYDANINFIFDLEVDTWSDPTPTQNYYARSGVYFDFRDADYNRLGVVWYLSATTDYIFDILQGSPTWSLNKIAENTMHHFDLSVTDILSQIDIDYSQIDKVLMVGEAYGSINYPPSVYAHLWLDDVCVDNDGHGCHGITHAPEPSTYLLLGSGMLGLAYWRRRKKLKG
ncbi:MAG: PEP-CTERM sorting domain-containing protein [Thermodesulfobacteriota bacterium]